MKKFIFLLTAMLLLSSSCNEEEIIIFDISVKNQDNSVVTEGFVRLSGNKPTFSGGVALYDKKLSLSKKGKISIEIPLDPKITEFHVSYWKNGDTPSQTIVGCNHPFDPPTCELSGGERKFVIDITLR